jgi:hypothetical protein
VSSDHGCTDVADPLCQSGKWDEGSWSNSQTQSFDSGFHFPQPHSLHIPDPHTGTAVTCQLRLVTGQLFFPISPAERNRAVRYAYIYIYPLIVISHIRFESILEHQPSSLNHYVNKIPDWRLPPDLDSSFLGKVNFDNDMCSCIMFRRSVILSLFFIFVLFVAQPKAKPLHTGHSNTSTAPPVHADADTRHGLKDICYLRRQCDRVTCVQCVCAVSFGGRCILSVRSLSQFMRCTCSLCCVVLTRLSGSDFCVSLTL